VTSKGKGGDAMCDALAVVHERGADILAIGSAALDVPATNTIVLPETAEEVAPILEILPVQRLAHALSIARGGDPDQPRGLHKVTRTR
jgi:glucosamine--fructose-6-phosphate aminotransferase (isomerizing)